MTMTPTQREAAARLIEGPRTSSVLWGRAVAALLRELLADGCNSPAQTLAAIARHREALRDLANAADAVGVRYFDSDDPSDEVQAMQAATINAREVLRA